MSWMYFKSLNDDPELWGIKKTPLSNFTTCFKRVLKRCGRFLTHLVFETCKVNNDIVNLVRRECPNLQDIDFSNDSITNKNYIQDIKSIFDKAKKCIFAFDFKVTDEDLKTLFSLNDKLEYLDIYFIEDSHSFTFLNELPHETIRELIIFSDISLNRIIQVSLMYYKS